MDGLDDVVHHGWIAGVSAPAVLPRATKSGKAVFGLLTSTGRLSLFAKDPLVPASKPKRGDANSPLECLELAGLTDLAPAVVASKRAFAVRFDCQGPVELRLKTRLQAEQWLMGLRLQFSQAGADPNKLAGSGADDSSAAEVLESDEGAEENPFELCPLGDLIKSGSEDNFFGAEEDGGWLNAADAFQGMDRHPDEAAPVLGRPTGLAPLQLDDDGFATPMLPKHRRPSAQPQQQQQQQQQQQKQQPQKQQSQTQPETPRSGALLPPSTPVTASSHERRRSVFGLFSARKSSSYGNLNQLRQAEEPQAIRPSRKSMAPGDFPELYGEGGNRRLSLGNWIRAKVSKKKRRFTAAGFDLDLSYITPRIIAMGFPSEKLEGLYRNRMSDVVSFFRSYHAGGHTRIYNLCSERSYAGEQFTAPPVSASVVRYPFDDHNPCQLEQVIRFCKDAAAFLREDESNVVAVHCKAGKGRTGMLVACLLMYLRLPRCATAQQAIEYYARYRTKDGKGITISSQLRYVRYFDFWLRLYGKNLRPLPWADEDDEDEDPASPNNADDGFRADFVPAADFFQNNKQQQQQQQQQQSQESPTAEAIPAAVPPSLQRVPLVLRSISVQGSTTAWKLGGRSHRRRNDSMNAAAGAGNNSSGYGSYNSSGNLNMESLSLLPADPVENNNNEGRRSRRGSFVASLFSGFGGLPGAGQREPLLVAEVYKPRSRARDRKNLEQVADSADRSNEDAAGDDLLLEDPAEDGDDLDEDGDDLAIPDVPFAVSQVAAKPFSEDQASTLQFAGEGVSVRDDFYLVVREVSNLDQYPYRELMNGGSSTAAAAGLASGEFPVPGKKAEKAKVKLQKPGNHGIVFKVWLHTGMLAFAPPEVNSTSALSPALQPDVDAADPGAFEVTFRKADLDGVSKRKEVEESFGCAIRFARPGLGHRTIVATPRQQEISAAAPLPPPMLL